MLYIDTEPLHEMKIPQMSKLIEKNPTSGIKVKDMFSIYSTEGSETYIHKIEHMNDIFMNLVDLCQAKIKEYKDYYMSPINDGSGLRKTEIHDSDKLLEDYYQLLNKLLGFGVISFFKRYETLAQLAKFSMTSIQVNSANPTLSYILDCSKKITDSEIKTKIKSPWKIKPWKFLKKILNQKRIKPEGNPLNYMDHNDEDDIEIGFNLEDDKNMQQHPLMRNCLLLQKSLSDSFMKPSRFMIMEAEIKIKACKVLNKIFDLR